MPNPNSFVGNQPFFLSEAITSIAENTNKVDSNLDPDMSKFRYLLTKPNETASKTPLNGSVSIFDIEYNAYTGELCIQVSKYLKDRTITIAEGRTIHEITKQIALQLDNARENGQDFSVDTIETIIFGIKNWVRCVRQVVSIVDAILVKFERIVNESKELDF